MNAVEQSGTYTRLDINSAGTGLDVVSNLSNATLNIFEAGATATSFELGILAPAQESSNIFALLIELEEALTDGDRVGVSVLLADIEPEIDRIGAARGDTGAKVRRLEASENRRLDEEINITNLLSHDFDTDYIEAKTLLQFRQNTFEAALKIGANILPLSLVEFI